MKVLFLGTGPAKPVIRKSEKRSNSSVLIDGILIDCTPMFLEQAKRENIKPEDVHAVLITHAHRDAIGGLGDLDKWVKNRVSLYYPSGVNIHRFIKKFEALIPISIEEGKSFKLYDNDVTAFRVIHAEAFPTGKDFPAFGYKINNLVYAEDMEKIPKESVKYFKDAETIVADGAMWFGTKIRGHLSTDQTLQLAKQFNPKNLVIIQAGRTYPSQENAEKEIESYWKSIKNDTKTNISLAYDGMKMELHQQQMEEKLFPGIYLPSPHAKLIWEGQKKLIVKAKSYPNMIDKNLYYMDREFCFGILKLKEPRKINLDEFAELENKHRVTKKERAKWWKDKSELYLYEFDVIDTFESPKPINLQGGTQTFVKDTKFMAITASPSVAGAPVSASGLQPIWIFGKRKKKGVSEKMSTREIAEMIQDVKAYDPSKPNNSQLADDWRIVNGWYATYKRTNGEGIKFSKETIINLAKLIYNEITKRVKEEKMKHEFKTEEMKPSPLELYKIVSQENILSDWKSLEFLNELQDFIIIKDCISLIGSSVTQEHKPNDIDLLIKMKEPSQFLKRAIETRLSKMVPEKLQDKLHFVWGEQEGPHDSFIPIFDLEFKKIMPNKVITMKEKVEPLKPYLPMKPKGSAYYELDKLMGLLFK